MTTRADAGLAANPFTDAERSYLGEVHPMARLATVGADGTPHVTPLAMYEIEDATGAVVTRGKDLTATKKWRDVTRSGRAALVVDDVLPPFRPRGIEIRGRAEAVADPSPVIRLFPERIVAWGLDATTGVRHARDVDASPEATRHSC